MAKVNISVLILLLIQILLLIIFGIFARYNDVYEKERYAMFQDVHVMIFVGFGLLMTFLKKYGYSSVGYNLLLASITAQWAIIVKGLYDGVDDDNKIGINLDSLYVADITTATILISMGAVLGRTTYLQLIFMGLVEVVAVCGNMFLAEQCFKVTDAGGSIFIHTFGAYFGLAVSFVLNLKKDKNEENSLNGAIYHSDLFSMIGTVFLWVYWPSFNAVELHAGQHQQHAVINTYLSLTACCVTAFAFSGLMGEGRKFDMVHIQNSTLAGGVAIGSVANLMVEPYGAVGVGMLAGAISVFGYSFLSKKFGIFDTCGINNLHGMPGILSGILSGIMASFASEDIYGVDLYAIFPAMAPGHLVPAPGEPWVPPGDGRSAGAQAGYQILALVVTLLIAMVTGLITGLILICPKLNTLNPEDYYMDETHWKVEE